MANYATLTQAQAYLDGVLNTEAWDNADATTQTKALTMGTKAIDQLNYRGDKAEDSQVNQFPRAEDTDVPDAIVNASVEIALRLLDGVDPELEYENLRMIAQGYSNVRSTYDSMQIARHIVAGIPSITAWRYLFPYLRESNSVELNRVS